MSQVALIEDKHARQLLDRAAQVFKRSRKARLQLVDRDVVSSLGNPHADALNRSLGRVETDETQRDVIALLRGIGQELHFLADGIGEDGLEHEAFPLADKQPANTIGDVGSGVGIEVELCRNHVGIHPAKTGERNLRVEERRLPGTVGTGDGDQMRRLSQLELKGLTHVLRASPGRRERTSRRQTCRSFSCRLRRCE